jgi:hypothetical protein
MLVQKGSSPAGNHSIARIYASGPAKRLVLVYSGWISNESIWLLRQILALVADWRAAGNPPRVLEYIRCLKLCSLRRRHPRRSASCACCTVDLRDVPDQPQPSIGSAARTISCGDDLRVNASFVRPDPHDAKVSCRSRALRLAPVHSSFSKHRFEARQTARCLLPGQLHRIAESHRSVIPFHRRGTKAGRRRDSRIARYSIYTARSARPIRCHRAASAISSWL